MNHRPLLVALFATACSSSSSDPNAKPTPDDAGSDGETTVDATSSTLACPTQGTELASGAWSLEGDCAIGGDLVLSGTARLSFRKANVVIDGDIRLQNSAELAIEESSFTIDNHYVFEHDIDARDDATFTVRDSKFATNAGKIEANLTSNYNGFDRSRARFERVEFSVQRSWLLAAVGGSAEIETIDSPDFPTELYPRESATITVRGPGSGQNVWLPFPSGSKAELADLPTATPFSYNFGRETAGVTDIDYQLHVIDAKVTLSVFSYPGSSLAIANNAQEMVIGYKLVDVTSDEVLEGITPTLTDATLTHQGRVLSLSNAKLAPFGWQIYNENAGVSGDPGLVTIKKSVINEVGSLMHGNVRIEDSTTQFAVLMASGEGSKLEVERTIINSQSIIADGTSSVIVRDSEIWGSLVQARDSGTVVLLNNVMHPNECHPGCSPQCVSFTGGNECNPVGPKDVGFHVDGAGAVVVLSLDPPAAVSAGAPIAFVGSAFIETKTSELANATYSLGYRPVSETTLTPIVASAPSEKKAEPLGTLETSGLAPGGYVAVLSLNLPGESKPLVGRPFQITP